VIDRDPVAAAGLTPAPTPGLRAERARAAVRAALADCPDALAAWEAGSAAFGRADESSDLDVGVLCAADAGTLVLDRIGDALATIDDHPIDAWDHGRSLFGVQRFWRPRPAGDESWCMVDVSVIELERQRDEWGELLSPERHGRALPLHDHDGVLERCRREAGLDLDAHRARLDRELSRIRDRRALFFDMPGKELARGRVVDALAMHDSMVTASLVALLGMRHRPLRFDFGRRYLHDELPRVVVERLLPILAPGTRAIDAATAAGLEWIDELLELLPDATGIPIEAHAEQMRAAFG
jgi:predicted nucleotidyltransferase